MKRLMFGVVTLAVALMTTAHGAGQPRPASAKPFAAPRTAWGDPDISGNFTNLYEVAIRKGAQ